MRGAYGFLISLAVAVATLPACGANSGPAETHTPSATTNLSDTEIRKMLIRQSIAKYEGQFFSGILFGIVALLQLARALNHWPVQIGPIAVPIWFSWCAAVVVGALCIWGLRTARPRGGG